VISNTDRRSNLAEKKRCNGVDPDALWLVLSRWSHSLPVMKKHGRRNKKRNFPVKGKWSSGRDQIRATWGQVKQHSRLCTKRSQVKVPLESDTNKRSSLTTHLVHWDNIAHKKWLCMVQDWWCPSTWRRNPGSRKTLFTTDGIQIYPRLQRWRLGKFLGLRW